MTDQEKATFLKSQGWRKTFQRAGIYWIDPQTPSSGPEWVQLCPFDEAYRLASRRKSAREARRLKAAGWHWRCASRFHAAKAGWVHADYSGRHDKSEALKLLEAR